MNPYSILYLASFSDGARKAAAEMTLPRREKPDVRAEEIVPMDTAGGALADYLLPSSIGSFRAGKSEAMARSVGRSPSLATRRPISHALLYQLAGAGIGGVGGALVGHLVGSRKNNPEDPLNTPMQAGAGIGSGLGGLVGIILAGRARRKDMEATNKAFDAATTVTPYARRGNPLAILGGPHESGRAEGFAATLGHPMEGPHPLNVASAGTQAASAIGGLAATAALGPAGSLATLPLSVANSAVHLVSGAEQKRVGRRRTADLLAQAMGYAPRGMGVSTRQVPVMAHAATQYQ